MMKHVTKKCPSSRRRPHRKEGLSYHRYNSEIKASMFFVLPSLKYAITLS